MNGHNTSKFKEGIGKGYNHNYMSKLSLILNFVYNKCN